MSHTVLETKRHESCLDTELVQPTQPPHVANGTGGGALRAIFEPFSTISAQHSNTPLKRA